MHIDGLEHFSKPFIQIKHGRDDITAGSHIAMRVIAMKAIDDLDRPLDDLGQVKKRDLRKVLEDLIAAMGPLLGTDDLMSGP